MKTGIDTIIRRIKPFINNHPKIFRGTVWRDTHKRLRHFIKNTDVILDIGSLDAPYTKYLPNRVVAIDIPSTSRYGFSDEILKELDTKKNFNSIFADAEALPFKDNLFGKIIFTEVLEHIYNDESAVSEMARVLKPDGKVFLTTPNGDVIPLEHGIKEHVRHYSEKNLYNLLCKYFQYVDIQKRFHLHNLLNVQYNFKNSFNENKSRIWLYLMSLITSYLYDAIYLVERHIWNGRYNFVAVCSKPKKEQ